MAVAGRATRRDAESRGAPQPAKKADLPAVRAQLGDRTGAVPVVARGASVYTPVSVAIGRSHDQRELSSALHGRPCGRASADVGERSRSCSCSRSTSAFDLFSQFIFSFISAHALFIYIFIYYISYLFTCTFLD